MVKTDDAKARHIVDTIGDLLSEIEPLRRRLKECSAIYQYGLKVEAAQAWGKTVAYFDVEYRKWSRYRKLLERKRQAAFQACRDAGIPCNMPFSEFPLYRQLMGCGRNVALV